MINLESSFLGKDFKTDEKCTSLEKIFKGGLHPMGPKARKKTPFKIPFINPTDRQTPELALQFEAQLYK